MTVVLYGATGYTGRLVTDELVRRGFDFVLSGRSAEGLGQVARERAPDAPVTPASLDDPTSLRRLLADAAVVINCAGPFMRAGDALVAAAVETGTHYLDSTGEQSYVRIVLDRHGRAAERAGVALVPAMGFDYAPGDCISRLTAIGHEPLDELVVAYSVRGFGSSRGTLRSALEIMSGGDVVYEDGGFRPAPRGVFQTSFDFPEPLGRQAMIRYPAGEVITVPRHTSTRKVTALLTATTVAPTPTLAPVVPYLAPALGLALRTPLRDLLARAVGALPEGPPAERRRQAEFTIAAVARDADGATARGLVRGTDPYDLTAVTLAYGAERLASEGYERAGALAPAEAFEPEALLNYLTDYRVAWSLDPATVAA